MEPNDEPNDEAKTAADPPPNWPCEPLREIALEMALRFHQGTSFGQPQKSTDHDVITTAERFHGFLSGTTNNTTKESK